MTSLFVSASLNASKTHFIAVSKSTISPLRTPRDGACPTPKIFVVPSRRASPTTTQILDVPISNPTIRSLLAISLFLLSFLSLFLQWKRLRAVLILSRCRRRRRLDARFHRRRRHWNCFHNPRRFLRIDRVVDYFRRWFHERDRNIPLHQQIDGFDLVPGIVGIDQKLFESLNLFLEMIESNCDSG